MLHTLVHIKTHTDLLEVLHTTEHKHHIIQREQRCFKENDGGVHEEGEGGWWYGMLDYTTCVEWDKHARKARPLQSSLLSSIKQFPSSPSWGPLSTPPYLVSRDVQLREEAT